MSCQKVLKSISAFLDQELGREERESVSLHLRSCRVCAAEAEYQLRLREAVREMRGLPVPEELADRLRVVASHECTRRVRRLNVAARLQDWVDWASLLVDNLMRPLALPFAGGLASALFLFGTLVPTLGVHRPLGADVPTALYTEPSLEETSPLNITDDETVVELTIDAQGRVVNYSIPQGKDTRQLEANLANALLFSRFSPATWFGQPTRGSLLISFRRTHMVVKG